MKTQRTATIHDIAREAGVSLTTVSHVLSGKRPVSEAVATRVRETIDRLGYTPNVLAQRLARQEKARTIGISLPGGARHLANPVFAEMVAGVADVAEAQHYQLLISASVQHDDQLSTFAHDGLVSGLLLCEVLLHDPRIASLQSRGVPFVLLGHSADAAPSSDADSAAGVFEAVTYLADLGHRRIAMVFSSRRVGYAERFLQGYKDAHTALGLDVDEGLIVECVSDTQRYYEAITRLLQAQHFTALLALNDGMDVVAAQAIRDQGLSVPEDVSLIGHSTLWSEIPGSTGITTLRIPARAIGAEAARMLLTQIAGETLDTPQSLFPYTFVHRASTAAPPAHDADLPPKMRNVH
jgi:LacI family transcriptional regulator